MRTLSPHDSANIPQAVDLLVRVATCKFLKNGVYSLTVHFQPITPGTPIEQIGLLHPIIVTTDYALIVGRRRLEAHKHLGRTTIEARVVDLDKPFEAEVDENEQRKDYTPSERVGIGEAREERDKEAAAQRKAEGEKGWPERKKKLGENLPSYRRGKSVRSPPSCWHELAYLCESQGRRQSRRGRPGLAAARRNHGPHRQGDCRLESLPEDLQEREYHQADTQSPPDLYAGDHYERFDNSFIAAPPPSIPLTRRACSK